MALEKGIQSDIDRNKDRKTKTSIYRHRWNNRKHR